ncbi:hypothetical protein KDW_18150 [Dictyobacter vulcani]|uniref:Uncharacterized protein n=1 Tax=Dictyobacter vulcani TaxID=2607529 RepID=A0A5J4KIU9_9CHLR|nr:hypothetical protein [Dictyobacter vulcani]GER87653.1 hypothetical protein KDW_18150 [Dictyobacter vulcani]
MAEQDKQQDKQQKQPDKADIYGAQGNQGQYGQGQYDSEGKPDPHGPQAQEIYPDDQPQKDAAARQAEQQQRLKKQFDHPDIPQD